MFQNAGQPWAKERIGHKDTGNDHKRHASQTAGQFNDQQNARDRSPHIRGQGRRHTGTQLKLPRKVDDIGHCDQRCDRQQNIGQRKAVRLFLREQPRMQDRPCRAKEQWNAKAVHRPFRRQHFTKIASVDPDGGTSDQAPCDAKRTQPQQPPTQWVLAAARFISERSGPKNQIP